MDIQPNQTNGAKTDLAVIIFLIIFLFWLLIPVLIAINFSRWFISFFYKQKVTLSILLTLFFLSLEIISFYFSVHQIIENKKLFFNLNYDNLGRSFITLLINLISIGGVVSFAIYLFWPLLHFMTRKLIFRRMAKWQNYKQSMLNKNELDFKYYREPLRIMRSLLFYRFYLVKLDAKNLLNLQKLDAVFLNKRTYILRKNLSTHTSVIGSTGSGKTNTLLHFCFDAIKLNKPLIFVDGKGDNELISLLNSLCSKHNRIFKVVSLDDNVSDESIKTSYNPFANKNEKEVIALLLEIMDFSKSRESDSYYYRQMERSILNLVVSTMMKLGLTISFKNIANYLQKNEFEGLIKKSENLRKLMPKEFELIDKLKADNVDNINQKKIATKINEAKAKLTRQISFIDDKRWFDIYNKVSIFAEAINNIDEMGINLADVLKQKMVILFSVKSLLEPTNAQTFADIILQDIKQQSVLNQQLKIQTTIIIDEFGALNASEIITTLLLQGRSMGFEIILGYQGLSELKKINDDFKDNVLNNTKTLICHNLNDIASAEEISKMFGTFKSENKTYQSNVNEISENLSGMGTFKVVDEFIVNPNQLKKLARGYAAIKTLDVNNDNLIFGIQKIDLVNTTINQK